MDMVIDVHDTDIWFCVLLLVKSPVGQSQDCTCSLCVAVVHGTCFLARLDLNKFINQSACEGCVGEPTFL